MTVYKYDKKKHPKEARKLAQLGAIEREIADFLEVSPKTIWDWKYNYPEFREALQLGKDEADERVVKALYNRAIGYSFDSEKVHFDKDGLVSRADIVEHVPPDTRACQYWLNNRRRGEWKNTWDIEHTHTIPLTEQEAASKRDLSDEDLNRQIDQELNS